MTLPSTSEPGGDAAHWAGDLLNVNLDLWLRASAQDSGLFYPFLDRQWQRNPSAPLTLVSQCRLIYNFCRGYELWRTEAYAEAARAGLAALTRFFAVSPGRWHWAVSPEGAPHADISDAYGHAFAILALATAGRVLNEPLWAGMAWQTWEHVKSAHTDDHGGVVWHLSGPDPFVSPRSQNPLMHLFEALMALHLAVPDGKALSAARDVLAFVARLPGFEAGALIEDYTAAWEPRPSLPEATVSIGHLFEWAWLLSEWHEITQDATIMEHGRRFLRTAARWGLTEDGGVRGSCVSDGTVTDDTHGLWPQCEAVRALSRYAARHGDTESEPLLSTTVRFYKTHFIDREYGGIFAGPAGSDNPASQRKGDPWKLDYHTLGMCLELMTAPTEKKPLDG